MRIETLQPTGERFFAKDLAVDVEVRVRDERNVPVPGASVKWTVDGHEHRLDQAVTAADNSGIARNKVTIVATGEPGPGRGTVRVQTPDGHVYEVGTFLVVGTGTDAAPALMFQPAPAKLFASPPARTSPGRKTAGNTLTIYYPQSTVKLPWGVPQYAWAQYLDSSGNPLKNQTLIPTGDFAVYIDPADPKPVTDDNGWAAVKLQTTPQLTNNPPFAPQEASGTLDLQSQSNPDDRAHTFITFSTTLGGRGYLTASAPSSGVTQGDWWPVTITYRMPDGTPGRHRVLNWTNLSDVWGGSIPISYSTAPQTPPRISNAQTTQSWTDQNGESQIYIITNDGYSAAINVTLMVTAANPMLAGGDAVQTTIPVSRRTWQATAWPIIWSYNGTGLQRPGDQITVNFTYQKPAPSAEGLDVYWGPAVGPLTVKKSPTKITNGSSLNWVTSLSVDAMFTGTVSAAAVYPPPPAPAERAYLSLLFANGNPALMHTAGHDLDMTPSLFETLASNTWYKFTIKYYYSGVGVGQSVRWYADPPDNIEFQQPYPGTIDSSGACSIQLRAVGLAQDSRILIHADVYNPAGGSYDSVDGIYTFSGQVAATETIVVNAISPSPVLYSASTVTATYTKGNKPVQGASVQWAGLPAEQLSFSPGISTTDANGIATTSVTGYGPNQASTFTIYASSYDDATQETVTGSREVQFAAASNPPAQNAARLDIQSPEGDTLWGQRWHVLQASYLLDDGTPVPGKRQVAWSVPDSNAVKFWESTTWTDEQGITTNLVQAPGTFQGNLIQATVQASTTNPSTNTQDTGALSLVLTANNIEPVSNVMTITVDGQMPIQSGNPCPVTVKYMQANLTDPVVGAAIEWSVYPYVEDSAQPPYELSFGLPNPTHTDNNGLSHNTITYNGSKDLEGVILVASAFNPITGRADFARQVLNFTYVPLITGIMINRPWANNPDSGDVDPTISCQVVKAKMTLGGGHGDGQINLTTLPADLGTQIFDSTGVQIQPVDGVYTVQTTDGSANISVGARYASFLALQAFYPASAPQPTCTTNLWLTQQGGRYGDRANLMTIQNLQPGDPPVMNIPDKSTWPNPYFTVSIPANSGAFSLDPNADVAILLNYRIAYTGKVRDAQLPNSVNIAYAMLQPTGNVIAYVSGSGKVLNQQGNLTFNAQGQAQVYPTTGGATATLPPPSLVPASMESIQATDVVDGLRVQILPTGLQPGWSYQAGDEITVYFYLSGTYPLPATATRYCPSITQPARNIASLQYTVVDGDELTTGQAKILDPLPQAFVAGYGAPGTIQVNFKVQRQVQSDTKVFWSKATGTMSMDTASVNATS